MNFENIVKKHGYDEEFSSFLEEVYNELVIYYGNEDIVYEALLNTPIVSCDNIYNYLKENGLLEQNSNIINDGDLKRSSGVYQSLPSIIYDEETNEFKLQSIKRIVAVVNFDLNSYTKKSTLIHELSHLIKSYHNEFVIEGDTLIERSGLIEKHYELQYDGTKVKLSLINEKGIGLEEGLTSACEEDIMRKIVDPSYSVDYYRIINSIARNLLAISGAEDSILAEEIYHTKDEIFKYLKEEELLKLENLTDKVYVLLLKMASTINIEEIRNTGAEIKTLLNNEYESIMKNISNTFTLN